MAFHIRFANGLDMPYLLDIDLKSFDEEFGPEMWEMLGDIGTIRVAASANEPVGFAIYQHDAESLFINRLAVKKDRRRQGVGSSLINDCMTFAKDNKIPLIETRVPECWCCPGQPQDATMFLKAVGFKAGKLTKREYEHLGEAICCIPFTRWVR